MALQQVNINIPLSNLAVSDLRHDFNHNINQIRDMLMPGGVLNPYYNDGVPDNVGANIFFEGQSLSNVVRTVDNTINTGYIPTDFQQNHRLETINNKPYSVNYVVAKNPDNTYIDASTFLGTLGIPNDSAIIVDATAVSIFEILHTGERDENFNIYYIMAPEVINDPAGKTPLHSSTFNPTANGINLIPCDSNMPPGIEYTYKYDAESTDPYDKFYTSYIFTLSEIQRNLNGKSLYYSTNLGIRTSNNVFISDPIIDSGEKNDITSLSSLISDIMALLFGSKKKSVNTPKQIFMLNNKFQQKRTGDWFQVLLCLIIKLRECKKYRKQGPQQEGDISIQNKFTNVYLITHDRIAVAFALLMGVNVLYAHGATHSVYSFTLDNPAEIITQKIVRLTKIIDDIPNMVTKKRSLENFIRDYDNQIYSNVILEENIINDAIQELNGIVTQTYIPVDKIIEVTQRIFRRALVYCYLKKEIPDLNREYNTADNAGFMGQTITRFTSDELQKQLLKLKTLAILTQLEQQELFIQTQKDIDDYDKFINMYNRYKNILEKYVDISTNKAKVSFVALRKIVTKTPAYKFANEWTWNISISSRIWAAFTSYSNDRNIFLYDLNLLPDNMKNAIVHNYKILYEKIKNDELEKSYFTKIVTKTPIQMKGKELTKFITVMSAFCTEVFLNLTTEGNKPDVISDIENFIKTAPLDQDFNTLSEEYIIAENNEIIQNDNTQNTKSSTSVTDVEYAEPDITLHGGTINIVYDNLIIPTLIIEQICQQATHPLLTMLLLYSSFTSIDPTQMGIIERVLDETGLPPGDFLEEQNVARANYEQEREREREREREQEREREREREQEREQEREREREQAGGIGPEDIFKTVLSIFHPLLPIYMIGNSFLSMGQNNDMDESLDYELYINYSTYLNKLKTTLLNVYSGENNTTENKWKAYKIGFGLRELLFYSSDEEIYSIFCGILGMTHLEYFPISAMTDILSNKISGQAIRSDEEKRESMSILQDEIFISFMNTVNPKEIFSGPVDRTQTSIDMLNKSSYNFVIDTGKMIISDRQGNGEFQIPPIQTQPIQMTQTQTQTSLAPIQPPSTFVPGDELIQELDLPQAPQTDKKNDILFPTIVPSLPEDFDQEPRAKPLSDSSILYKTPTMSRNRIVSSKTTRSFGGNLTRRYKKLTNNQNKRSNRKKRSNRNKKNGKYRTRRIHKKSKHIRKNTRRNRK